MTDRKKQLENSAKKLAELVNEADRVEEYYERGRDRKFRQTGGVDVTRQDKHKFMSAVIRNENLGHHGGTTHHTGPSKPIPILYWLVAIILIATPIYIPFL